MLRPRTTLPALLCCLTITAVLPLLLSARADADESVIACGAFPNKIFSPFTTSGMTLLKRCTLVIDDGAVAQVFYPVFPPDQSAAEVMTWLSRHRK